MAFRKNSIGVNDPRVTMPFNDPRVLMPPNDPKGDLTFDDPQVVKPFKVYVPQIGDVNEDGLTWDGRAWVAPKSGLPG